jgi:hypothetical protein
MGEGFREGGGLDRASKGSSEAVPRNEFRHVEDHDGTLTITLGDVLTDLIAPI